MVYVYIIYGFECLVFVIQENKIKINLFKTFPISNNIYIPYKSFVSLFEGTTQFFF